MLMEWIVVSLLLLLEAARSSAQLPTYNTTGQVSDLFIASSGQLFVSVSANGTGVVYRLNGSLAQQELLQFPSGTSVLRLSLSSDESRLVACLSNRSCIEYDANNLAKGPVTVFNNILTGGINVSLVSAPVSGGGNSFYVGSSNGTLNLIGQYGLDGTAGSVSRTSGNLFSVTASTFNRNWYGGFVAGSYTYFVVLDVSTSSGSGMRVLRVCDNSNETSVAAMVETELNCLGLATRIDAASRFAGASLVNAYPSGTSFEPTIVVAAVTPNVNGGTFLSRVCTFSLATINSAIANVSSRCSSGALPWRSSPSSPSCYSTCNTSSPGAISTPALVQTNDILNTQVGNTSFDLSYTLSFNYESLTLLLIAYTNQLKQSFVQVYRVNNAAFLGVLFATWPMPGPVTRLTWTSGQNYVYAITSTSVVQVPIEQCSSFTDCLSCAANVSPLCGWCTVEQKCSRRSQCQNSTVSARWVQGNKSQCLSNTSVTPTTFILERSTNITLTISSGLPSPLTGESFLCLLSTGNGVPISVPCSQVNQTTFTSDITSTISKLNIPKLVTSVGFGSSWLNISFATSQSKLSAYNCAVITSCSSCLQTDGVCGWCNVEKRCTAVNSSCSNFISVTSAGGQTYLDVCPSLLNGSYLSPVAVNRPLVLNTKNLPPLISGYMYACNVRQPNGPDITLPANYTNTTSISCLYTAAQISLPDGTSTMLANVSLIWTNSGTVVYPIDPLGVIQVTLYSCSAFSFTSCTSCLAVNIGTGYGCGWCGGTSRCVEPETCPSVTNQLLNCPSPVLRSVSPSSGPFGGGTRLTITGTDLGVTVGDIANVTVGGVYCSVQSDGYTAGKQIVCVTGNYSYGGMPQTVPISVTMRSGSVATAQYTYVRPSISSVFPKSGPMAGGTTVTIEGMSLNVGNGVKRVLLNGATCVILQSSLTQVNCTSSAQNVTGVGVVTVYIDNEVTINNAVTFEYTNNPNYTSVSPVKTIPAGGIILTFNGTYLNVSQKALLVINGMAGTFPCNQTFTTLKCYAPPLGSNPIGSSLSPGVDYTIVMDGAPGPFGDLLKIAVVSNPVFTSINPNDLMQTVGSVKIIRINGMNIMNVDILSEIMVTVGGERCTIDLGTTTDTSLSCNVIVNISSSSPVYPVLVLVGTSLAFSVGSLNFIAVKNSVAPVTSDLLPIVVSAVGGGVGVAILVIVAMVPVVCCVIVVNRRKKARLSNLMIEMGRWEAGMANECRTAFAELQIDLNDVMHVKDGSYPFRDFASYAMRLLFPRDGDQNLVLKPVEFSNGKDHEEALKQLKVFKELLLDKAFLVAMIQALEGRARLTFVDRSKVASFLIVALQNELPYVTDVLMTLLSDLMRSSAANSQDPKLLLRRTESVAEKLLSNWLCFLLYPHIKEHVGEPLFILFRAIKSQLEKGPVDVITGEARNSLSEEKLLRQHLDVNVVEGVVENENEVVPIKLLDTDTISQAKEKILDALYKNTPFSRRPPFFELDLELRKDTGTTLLLRDHDSSNDRDGEWVKVNTIGHYRHEMSWHSSSAPNETGPINPQTRFALVPSSDYSGYNKVAVYENMPSSSSCLEASMERRHIYHLVKSDITTSNVVEGEVIQGRLMSEVFLPRLLSTKMVLQPYVEDLFKAIFAVPTLQCATVPKAVKYLFDFLDHQAAEIGIHDRDTIHRWKTNSLPTRFWVSVIKNPDFVFDIHKSATVDSCLHVISQAYVDACSTSETKYTKDTPSSKLLFANEMQNYRISIYRYYEAICSLPKLESGSFEQYLQDTVQTCLTPGEKAKDELHPQQLYSDSALYELFKIVHPYSSEVVEALEDNGLGSKIELFNAISHNLS